MRSVTGSIFSPPLRAPHRGLARLAVILLSGVWLTIGPAAAQVPRNAREMLDNGIANLRERRDQLIPTMVDVSSAVSALDQLEGQRKLARRVIALDFPMDDFTGILMSDSFDEAYLGAVDTLTARFLESDRTLPPAAAGEAFRSQVGELPPLDENPPAYAVVFVIGRCLAAAGSYPATGDPGMKAAVQEVALRAIGSLTHDYLVTRQGPRRRASDDSWQDSVVERLRCQTHKSSYVLKEARNGLRPDGSLYRRYLVICNAGKEERKLDFDLGAAGVLTQNRGRQNLRKPLARPADRQPGVDQ